MALRSKLALYPRHPVGLPGLPMHCRDQDFQPSVFMPACGWLGPQRVVVAAVRDVQYLAHQLHRIVRKVESHRLYPRGFGSDSCAKYAAAFFTMSRSISAWTSCLRSFAFSASNSATERLPGAAVAAGPRLAAATQLASVPFDTDACRRLLNGHALCQHQLHGSSLSSGLYVFFNVFIKAPVGELLPNKSVRKNQSTSLLPCPEAMLKTPIGMGTAPREGRQTWRRRLTAMRGVYNNKIKMPFRLN